MDRACPGPRNPADRSGDERSGEGLGPHLDLGLFLDGGLPDDLAGVVEQHLFGCQACRERLDGLRELCRSLEQKSLWTESKARERQGCLTAAELLAVTEGRPSERALSHLATCASCRTDAGSIEDSAVEQASGKLEPAKPEIVAALKALKAGGETARGAGRRVVLRAAKKPAAARSDSSRRRLALEQTRSTVLARILVVGAAAVAASIAIALLLSHESGTEAPHEPPKVANQAPESPREPKREAPETPKGQEPPKQEPEKNAPKNAPDELVVAELPKPDTDHSSVPEKNPVTPSGKGTSPETPRQGPGEDPKDPESPVAPPNSQVAETHPVDYPSPFLAPIPDDNGQIAVELAQGGTVQHTRKGKTTTLSRSNGKVALKVGDRLHSNSGAFLSLEGGTYEVCLKGELVIRGASAGPVLGIGDGRVACEVEKLPRDKKLLIVTHSGEFEVTGTLFSVETNEKRAICAVEEGTVLCRGVNKDGSKSDPRPVSAGEKLTLTRGQPAGVAQPAGAVALSAWAQALRPERVSIFNANFDTPGETGGFVGTTTPQGAFRGVGNSLLFEVDSTPSHGLTARIPRDHAKWIKATPDLRLQFSFWLEQESPFVVYLYNERQQKFFKRELGKQPAGKWITVTIPVMELEACVDPKTNPVSESDTFSAIEFYTGNLGDRWKALLDDVMLYRKIYNK